MNPAALHALPLVPIDITPPRKVRCHVLNRRRNPCPNPAIDPDAKTPICLRHMTEICQDAIHLIGRDQLEVITGDGDTE